MDGAACAAREHPADRAAGSFRVGVKLQQLRYVLAVIRSDLNVSAAAKRLHSSQSALSKQIRLLEEELGIDVFVRSGRQLVGITAEGERIVERARHILADMQAIKDFGDQRRTDQGVMSIGTTHTQARYVLPPILQRFRSSHPGVQIQLHVGTAEQIAEMAGAERIDFAIATGAAAPLTNWLLLPLYTWHRCIIVPRGHPLAEVHRPTLQELARHPLITYGFSLVGPSSFLDTFAAAGLSPNIALTARDSDVIKTYVRVGLGIGVVAEMAIDPQRDTDLVVLPASHLFPGHRSWVGVSRGTVMRRYMYEFIASLAPHLNVQSVDRALACAHQSAVDALFERVALPAFQRVSDVGAPAVGLWASANLSTSKDADRASRQRHGKPQRQGYESDGTHAGRGRLRAQRTPMQGEVKDGGDGQ